MFAAVFLRSIAQMFFRDETKAFGFFVPTPPRGRMLPGHCCRVFSFLPPLRPCQASSLGPFTWLCVAWKHSAAAGGESLIFTTTLMLRVHQWGYMRFNRKLDDTYDSDTPLMWKHLEDLLDWSCLCVRVNLLFGLVQLGAKKVALRCGDPSLFLRKTASWTSHHLRLRLFDTWTDPPVFFILCIFFDFIYLFTCHFLTSPFICFSDLGGFLLRLHFNISFSFSGHASCPALLELYIFSTWQHLHPPWKIMDPSSGCLK